MIPTCEKHRESLTDLYRYFDQIFMKRIGMVQLSDSIFILILFSTLVCGLMAGLFFTWSYSVMPGLARVSDSVFLDAIKSMNRAIQNPLFFSCFFSAALLLPASTYMLWNNAGTPSFWLLLGASFAYWTGVMGVTIFGNVPLNNKIDAFHHKNASEEDRAIQRARFEGRWNRLNYIRTASSLAAFALVTIAILSA